MRLTFVSDKPAFSASCAGHAESDQRDSFPTYQVRLAHVVGSREISGHFQAMT